jgi:hypothetical protein
MNRLGLAAAAGAAVTALSLPAWAQGYAQGREIYPESRAASSLPGYPRMVEATTGYGGPNRALIGTGLVTFGLSYIPAVVVAGSSTLEADHHLYVPVAGPWLNMANRPLCGPESIACDIETTNKVLLAVDGVFQGIGAVTTLIGFVTPERETILTSAKVGGVHLTPAKVGRTGYGLAAFGEF